MHLFAKIKPRYIVAVTAAVTMLMIASALIELSQSREELFHILQEQGLSLAETIERSSANVLLATEQIESLLTERLLNNAFFIARLDSAGLLTQRDLERIAAANSIYRINIFDRRGNRTRTSHRPVADHEQLAEQRSPREVLAPILRRETDRLIIGLRESRFPGGQRYAVAVRRTHPSGGAIVLNLDAKDLLEFRLTIGIGKLMKDLGDNTGIEYAVVQDREGILAASSSVHEISAIESDTVLTFALTSDTTVTRVTSFRGKEIFEIVRPFTLDRMQLALIRVGLSMDEVRSTEARMQRRLLIASLVAVGIGVLLVLIIIANQNYGILSQRYRAIQTFTGNILEQMRDAVVTIDADERITLFNQQAESLFGISAASVLGRSLRQTDSTALAPLRDLFASDEEKDHTMRGGDGSIRIVSVALSTTTAAQGTVQSRTAVIRDLTEARRLEREMQRREKLSAMGELASGAAHEIRNPLNAISMIAQRFAQEFTPKKGLQEYKRLTRVLQTEAKRVNNIVQQFLQFARPAKLHRQRVAVKDFVVHVGRLFEGQARARGVRFSTRLECDRDMSIDRDQLTQALLNLLQNALDATPKGGNIVLNCSGSEAGVSFEVSDNGSGIPADQLDKIFNLYYTTKSHGTGMGLSITQQIVAQHGGRIDVASEVGKGSHFTISFPSSG